MINISIDKNDVNYLAVVDGTDKSGGGLTPSEALRALADVIENVQSKEDKLALSVAEAMKQEDGLGI